MADVRRARERGQMLLVAAISLAVLFVAFASVLNAATFAEASATRGADADLAADAASVTHAASGAVETAIVSVNELDDASHAERDATLAAAVEDWDAMAGTHAAANGRAAALTLDGIESGRSLAQDATRNFTSATGTANWTLATDVTATRGFTLTVADANALRPNGTQDAFAVAVDGGVWTATVARTPGGGVAVTVADPTGTSTCTTDDSSPTLDLSAGTLAGEACASLRFADDVGDTYDVAFANGDAVVGSYALVVDRPVLSAATQVNYGTEDEAPTQTPAVYAATVEVVYESPTSRYVATVRVEPAGDASAAGGDG